jgi:hypothetical protein
VSDLQTILEQTRDADLRLSLVNNKLAIKPASMLTDELRGHLQAHRDAIILAIKNAPARLVRLAIVAGIHEQGYQFTTAEIRKLRRESDLQDSINCTLPELQAWASALAIAATRQRGKTPAGLQ